MTRETLQRASRALAQRCLLGAAAGLCCISAQAQSLNSNAVAVAFSGGDTSGPPGVVNGVQLNVEVTDGQVAQGLDFRSMSLVVDVDCHGGREKVRKAAAFDLPNLSGPPKPLAVSGEWAAPEAYMREVVNTICATHGPRFVEPGAGERLAVARGPTSPAEPPRPPAAPAYLPEAPAFSAAPSPAPHPYPEPDAAPAALAAASPTPPYAPGRSSPASSAAGFSARARVQIASSPSRAEAKAMLDRSAALMQPPLKGEIEVATVRGRTVYRAIIAPFGSESEARAFCARTGLALEGCFVWGAR
jgi:SPOR domain